MIFSSPIFLFLFLPLVLTLYPVFSRIRLGNLWLLCMSIVFYAWGEPSFVWLMLASTFVNFALSLWMDRQEDARRRKWIVGIGIVLNLAVLAFFKYAGFAVGLINDVLGTLRLGSIHFGPVRLPIGISLFTFHALSYLIDIYRRKSAAARSPLDTGLYIFFFPQLIAGPILRWNAMAPQIAARIVTSERFAEGIRRFVYGLAKKMLVANSFAVPADAVFSLPAAAMSPALAWFGAVCYTLQIYYDFSGYSDMAIGMGKMFGFEFMENFNHPYIAQSIRDFWRRWHISLSTWFRDYLYFPLGGNRGSTARTCRNLLIVFFLCGLWHGAAWTFVAWGLFHGVFLSLERTRFGRLLERLPAFFRHLYTLLVVVIGWVVFRADDLPAAAGFLKTMFGLGAGIVTDQTWDLVFTRQVGYAMLAGIIFSAPFMPWLQKELARLNPRLGPTLRLARIVGEPLVMGALFIISAAWLAAGTYNPFIYFRF